MRPIGLAVLLILSLTLAPLPPNTSCHPDLTIHFPTAKRAHRTTKDGL